MHTYIHACMRAVPYCAVLCCACVVFFFLFPLAGLGFAAQWHASLRLAPYSPGAAGIPDEWYGHRRRRPRTRRGAFPFKHGLMTAGCSRDRRAGDRSRQPGTAEDRDWRPDTRTQLPRRGWMVGARLREQLELNGHYLTCLQVGPVITSPELTHQHRDSPTQSCELFRSRYHFSWRDKNDHNSPSSHHQVHLM